MIVRQFLVKADRYDLYPYSTWSGDWSVLRNTRNWRDDHSCFETPNRHITCSVAVGETQRSLVATHFPCEPRVIRQLHVPLANPQFFSDTVQNARSTGTDIYSYTFRGLEERKINQNLIHTELHFIVTSGLPTILEADLFTCYVT